MAEAHPPRTEAPACAGAGRACRRASRPPGADRVPRRHDPLPGSSARGTGSSRDIACQPRDLVAASGRAWSRTAPPHERGRGQRPLAPASDARRGHGSPAIPHMRDRARQLSGGGAGSSRDQARQTHGPAPAKAGASRRVAPPPDLAPACVGVRPDPQMDSPTPRWIAARPQRSHARQSPEPPACPDRDHGRQSRDLAPQADVASAGADRCAPQPQPRPPPYAAGGHRPGRTVRRLASSRKGRVRAPIAFFRARGPGLRRGGVSPADRPRRTMAERGLAHPHRQPVPL